VREIVFDTETTGLEPYAGHRLVEIGCIEIVNGVSTGAVFHHYVDPERDMPAEAFAVHGLSADFLRGKPKFAEIADALLEFVGDAKLVAHNAGFDFSFINAELERIGRPSLRRDLMVDTLSLARRRHPGAANRLDDLCSRYGIDTSRRTKHGALLDAELLAEVYAELTGGRQATLVLSVSTGIAAGSTLPPTRPVPLAPRLMPDDIARHMAFLDTLGGVPLWRTYLPAENAADAG
jgi:DNA polymerase-3 subunit epsilon